MRSMIAQFIIIVLILPFFLHLCFAKSQRIIKPSHSSKRSKASYKFALSEVHVTADFQFKETCMQNITRHYEEFYDMVIQENPSSPKCLLYCGLRRINMITSKADVLAYYVTSRIGGWKGKVISEIEGCVSPIIPNMEMICQKALGNVNCLFKHISQDLIKKELKNEGIDLKIE